MEPRAINPPDSLGHRSTRGGCDDIGEDVVLTPLDGKSLGEAHNSGLRGRVIGLAEVAV